MTHSTPELEPYLVLAQEIMRRVYADVDAHTLNSWIAHQLGRLGTTVGDNALTVWKESLDQYAQIITEARERAALPADQRRELVWPWDSWRQYLEPLEPGMLAVLSGADSTGKTIYAENIAEYWAKSGFQVLFAHFELNKRIMWHRRASRYTTLDFRTLRQGALGYDEQLDSAHRKLRNWQGGVNYLHTPGWTVDQLATEAVKRQSEGLCDVLVIDYLEKMASSERQVKMFNGQTQREADTVERLKILSESYDLPVFLLSQFSKAGKETDFSELDRNAMRGAGEKAERSNIIILLHREKLANGDMSPTMNVRIDKNTIGRTGNLQQHIDAAHFRIGDTVPVDSKEPRRK